MKRILVSCLLVFVCLSTVFASDNYVGGNIGFSWGIGNQKTVGGTISVSDSTISFGANGANYFSNSFGIGYSIGFSKTLSSQLGDIKEDVSDIAMPFTVSVMGLYKYNFNKKIALEVGAGLGNYISIKADNGVTVKRTGLSLDLKVGVLSNLQKNLAITGGLNMSIPVLNKVSTTTKLGSTSINKEGFKFIIGPYISVMYRY